LPSIELSHLLSRLGAARTTTTAWAATTTAAAAGTSGLG
jgi:hypothetical protein